MKLALKISLVLLISSALVQARLMKSSEESGIKRKLYPLQPDDEGRLSKLIEMLRTMPSSLVSMENLIYNALSLKLF